MLKGKEEKKNLLLYLVTGFFVIASLNTVTLGQETQPAEKAVKQTVKWYGFEEGFKKAKEENKYIIIDFWAEWCHWCDVMDEKTYANESVIKYMNENYIAIKVDTESTEKTKFAGKTYTFQEISLGFGVTSLPTTAWFESDGTPITKHPGFIEPDIFMNVLEFIGTGVHKTKVSFMDWVEKKSKGQK